MSTLNPSPATDARSHQTSSTLIGRLTRLFPPGQMVPYLCVGAFNTVFGYTTFAVINFALRLENVPASYLFAVAFSTFINVTVAYLGYKLFVFKTKGNYLREWSAAMGVSWSAFLPAMVLLPILVRIFNLILPKQVSLIGHAMDRKELAPYVANAFLTAVAVIYTFMGHKYITFRQPKGARGASGIEERNEG